MRFIALSLALASLIPARAFAGRLECQGVVLNKAIAAYRLDVDRGTEVKDVFGNAAFNMGGKHRVVSTEVHDDNKESYRVIFHMATRRGSLETVISSVNSADCLIRDESQFEHLTYQYRAAGDQE